MITLLSRILIRSCSNSTKVLPQSCYNALMQHEETVVINQQLDKSNINKLENKNGALECTVQTLNDTEHYKEVNALDTWTDDLPKLIALKKPPRTFAYIADQSKTIQKLVDLGVPLYKLESNSDTFARVCNLNYSTHVTPIINVLKTHELPWQHIFIKEPQVLLCKPQSISNLISYFAVQNFSTSQLLKLFSASPKTLLLHPKKIEETLTHIKKAMELKPYDLKEVITQCPRLLHTSILDLEKHMFSLSRVLEFDIYQIKQMFHRHPLLWIKSTTIIEKNCYYILEEMKLTRSELVDHCTLLTIKPFQLKVRHEFLVALTKAQYNKKKPGYISPSNMASVGWSEFISNIAQVDPDLFRDFVKTY